MKKKHHFWHREKSVFLENGAQFSVCKNCGQVIHWTLKDAYFGDMGEVLTVEGIEGYKNVYGDLRTFPERESFSSILTEALLQRN